MSNLHKILDKINGTENGHILYDFTGIIQQLNTEGIYFNNLFQLTSGLWQANFYNEKNEYEYGTGPTIQDAMSKAIVKLQFPEERKKLEKRHGLMSSPSIEDFLK